MLWSGCKESAKADYLGQAVRVQNFGRESLKISDLWFYQSPGKHIMKSLNFQILSKKKSKHFSGFYLKNWLTCLWDFFSIDSCNKSLASDLNKTRNASLTN
jgi:hypothetical protein